MATNGVVTVLHAFSGQQFITGPDGGFPQGGLVEGRDGSFYGTTEFGGAEGVGTVFRINTNGTLTNLHSFTYGSDGAYPVAALTQGTDGNFYGATLDGGTNDIYGGTVFQISTSGVLTSLYSFTSGNDGEHPQTALAEGADGWFYGTTIGGGTNGDGAVFKVTTNGVFASLHSFTGGVDGAWPNAGLVQGNDGSFYGSTENGGGIFKITTNGAFTLLHPFGGNSALALGRDGSFYGTGASLGADSDGCIFNMTTNGTLTILYSFTNGLDGGFPSSPLVQGSDGKFYGTDGQGISFGGSGVIFSFATNGTFIPLYAFPGMNDGQIVYDQGYGAGQYANASIYSGDGHFFGTTQYGGTNDFGNIFEISTNGILTNLYSFTDGADGAYPLAALVEGADGRFYDTASQGGTNGEGSVIS